MTDATSTVCGWLDSADIMTACTGTAGSAGLLRPRMQQGVREVPVRAIKTTTISILALGLLAGSAVGVAAQDEEAAAEPSTPAKVAGTIDGTAQDLVQEPTETVVDGVLEVRGVITEGDRFEMDDPRLTGTVTLAVNVDVHKVSDFEDVVAGSFALRLDNEAGSWSGQGTSVFHGGATIPEDEAFQLDTWLLTGAGAYEGLSAYLVVDGTEDPPTVEGVILAGEMPPFPALPAE